MSIVRAIIYGAAERGANVEALCEKVGITSNDLHDAEKMVAWLKPAPIWDYAIEMTGDPFLGLHIGQKSDPASYGILGFLIRSCPTVGDAMRIICKYNNTLTSIFVTSIEETNGEITQYFEPIDLFKNGFPESARQSVECFMAAAVSFMFILTGKSIMPVSADIAFSKRDVLEYEKTLKCQVNFNTERSSLKFSKAQFNTPVITYDKTLFALFNNLLLEKQNALKQDRSFAEEVQQALLLEFKCKIPTIEVIAEHMDMSTRTFQRRLKEENSSFRDITRKLQELLAASLLGKPDYDLAAIAAQLGYSNTGSFKRALESWKGFNVPI